MAGVPELVYWDGRGRAELIRITLAAANIKFKEIPLESREQFLGLMPELMFEQVPLLRIDGMSLVQTHSIVRYIGRKGKLLGTNDIEMARVDQLFEGTRDMYRCFFAFGFNIQSESTVREGVDKDLTKYLPIYNKVLADNGSTGFLVGSQLTIADIGLFEVIQATVDYFTEQRLKDFPEVLKFYKTMLSLENIKHYMAEIRKRPNDDKYCNSVNLVLGR